MKIILLIFISLISNSFAYIDYNLPDTIKPVLYDVILTINPNADTFTGNLTLTFNVTEATHEVQLHTAPDHIKIKKIYKLDGDQISNCTVNHTSAAGEIIKIYCTKEFSATKHRMNILYEGKITNDGKGIFKSSYMENGKEELFIATQFKPFYARRLFPSFDEPKFKAQFDISVVHPAEYTASGNTDSQIEEQEENKVITKFKRTPIMSSYMLALILTKLVEDKSAWDEDLHLTIHTRPTVTSLSGTVFNYAKLMTILMGQWTNISYNDMNLKKIDFVALPSLPFDASFSWGILIFDESFLLDEAELTTKQHEIIILKTMARGIAHQWFGGYTSQNWWCDSWLDESFASYFEFILPDMVNDLNLEISSQFLSDVVHVAFEEDSYYSDSLSSSIKEVQTKEQINNKLSLRNTLKGAGVINMLRDQVYEFQNTIREYLMANQYDVTTPTKLCEAADLCDFLTDYMYLSGYPILSLSLADEHSVMVNQYAFSLINTDLMINSSWPIPITYTTGDITEEDLNLKDIILIYSGEDPFYIEIKNGSWIIMNRKQSAFFRVNYDTILWQRIAQALKKANMTDIHVLNRAQLVDDIMNIARAGKVDYELVFNLVEYLKNERELLPWKSYFRGIKYIIDQLVDEETIQLLEKVSQYWLKVSFPEMNHDVNNTTSDLITNTMINEWKCMVNDEDCLSYVGNVFEEYKTSFSLSNQEERYLVFCNALKISSDIDNDYAFLIEEYKKSTSAHIRKEILKGLACAPTYESQMKLLAETLDSTIAKSEAITIINAVLENKNNGVVNVIQFLEENLEALFEKYNSYISFSTLITWLARKVNNETQLDKVFQLVESIDGLAEDVDELLQQCRGYIRMNYQWLTTYGENIKAILENIDIPVTNGDTRNCFTANLLTLLVGNSLMRLL